MHKIKFEDTTFDDDVINLDAEIMRQFSLNKTNKNPQSNCIIL